MAAPARIILNVDDHAPARFLRTRILERAGYGVDEGDSAAQALERAGFASLVLLDVKLPDGDGITVCERVKARYPQIPVVMVTSVYRTAQARRDAFAAGADAYLIEPLEPTRLVRTVDSLLSRAEGSPTVANDAWVITDTVGLVVEISPAAARLCNVSQRGARGRSLPMFFIRNRGQLLSSLRRAADGELVEHEDTLHPRDRRARPVRVSVALAPGAPGERPQLRWTIEETGADRSKSSVL